MTNIPLLPFPIVTKVLSNGLTVIVVKKPDDHGMASAALAIRGGAKNDGGRPGIEHVLEHMNYEGPVRKHGIHPTLRDVYRHGVEASAVTYYHYTRYSVKAARKFLRTIVSAVLDMGFSTVSCVEEDLKREQRSIEQEIREWQDRDLFPLWVARQHYPKSHWLHRSILGTFDSVQSITANHLMAHQAKYSVCQNAALVAVGDADEKEICELASAATMPQKSRPGVKPLRILSLAPVETVYVDPLSTASRALMSFTGADNPRQDAGLELLSRVLEDTVKNPLYQTLQKDGAIYELEVGHRDWPKRHQIPNWPDLQFTVQAIMRPEHFSWFKESTLDSLRIIASGSYPEDLFQAVMNKARMNALSPLSLDLKILGENIAQAWAQGESVEADRQALLLQMTPDDLSAAAKFLLSGKPSFISVIPREWKN